MYEKSLALVETFEECISAYENDAREIKRLQNEIARITELKNALFDKYHKKFAVIQEAEIRKYTDAEDVYKRQPFL